MSAEPEVQPKLTNKDKAIILLNQTLDNQYDSRSKKSLIRDAIKLLGYKDC